jgi:hypothetical protein
MPIRRAGHDLGWPACGCKTRWACCPQKGDPVTLTDAELAAMPDTAPHGSAALLALEEDLQLLADALALPSEADRCF